VRNYERLLVGHSGFVGTTLKQQQTFDGLVSRDNMLEAIGSESGLLVCAAAPAQKWWANKNPKEDLENIQELIRNLRTMKSQRALLISTVDVFDSPVGVDESDIPISQKGNAYGSNRRILELEFASIFPNSTVIRLPGLVGAGLRKNALYDLKQHNEVWKLNGASTFQFYPMGFLWRDVLKATEIDAPIVHLTGAPLNLAFVARSVFGAELPEAPNPAFYDFRTKYSREWHSSEPYQYSAEQSLLAIREYANA
jgi:dTDP-4-dehydrorhamnose reductase